MHICECTVSVLLPYNNIIYWLKLHVYLCMTFYIRRESVNYQHQPKEKINETFNWAEKFFFYQTEQEISYTLLFKKKLYVWIT